LGESQTNLLQGTLDLLILKAIGDGEFHGLGISRRIEQITHGTFRVKPGSLFPALHRMEEAGWLTSFWGDSENNRRAKFYRRTKAGERQLGIETEEWATIARAIANAPGVPCRPAPPPRPYARPHPAPDTGRLPFTALAGYRSFVHATPG